MKMSMLTKLVFGLIILSFVFDGGYGATTLEELGGFSVAITIILIEIAGAYVGLYLLLKGAKDAMAYLRS